MYWELLILTVLHWHDGCILGVWKESQGNSKNEAIASHIVWLDFWDDYIVSRFVICYWIFGREHACFIFAWNHAICLYLHILQITKIKASKWLSVHGLKSMLHMWSIYNPLIIANNSHLVSFYNPDYYWERRKKEQNGFTSNYLCTFESSQGS